MFLCLRTVYWGVSKGEEEKEGIGWDIVALREWVWRICLAADSFFDILFISSSILWKSEECLRLGVLYSLII